MSLIRLTDLPDRALIMSAAMMEFAYADDQAIYLVTYTSRPGAPVDPTKIEFDVRQAVFDLEGAQISPPEWRMTTHTIYNDPAAIGTPPEQTPAVQIQGNVDACVERLIGLLPQLTDPTPLYEQLAPQ